MASTADYLDFLGQLLKVGGNMSLWYIDKSWRIISTTCEKAELYSHIFELQKHRVKIIERFENLDSPCIIGSHLGPAFGVVANRKHPEDELRYVAIGPICYENISRASMKKSVIEHSFAIEGFSQEDVINALLDIPHISITVLEQELAKVSYILNGDTEKKKTIFSLGRASIGILPSSSESLFQDTYLHEQKLLNIVRSGDINFHLYDKDNIRHQIASQTYNYQNISFARVRILSFLILISRAAIEGGLSAVEAFTICDKYVLEIEPAQLPELVDIAVSLFDEFVAKVHACKNTKNYTLLVQKCISYIEQHINQKIVASDLAENLGYNDYYLTKKFHEETGMYLNEYIQNYKIEKAKQILETTDVKIQNISTMLGFSTCNYFCTCFRNITGMSPQNYRISKTKI